MAHKWGRWDRRGSCWKWLVCRIHREGQNYVLIFFILFLFCITYCADQKMKEYYCYGVEVDCICIVRIGYGLLHICISYYWQKKNKKKEERSGHPLGPFTSPKTLSIRIYLQIRIFINDAKYRLTWPWSRLGSLPSRCREKGRVGWFFELLPLLCTPYTLYLVFQSTPSIQQSHSAHCCHHAAATNNNRLSSVHNNALQ